MYRKGSHEWVKYLDFIILDVFCLHLAFTSAYMIRHGMHSPYTDYMYRNLVLILTLIQMIVVVFFGTMKNVLQRGYYKELLTTIKQVFLIGGFVSFYMFATQMGQELSRFVILATGFLYTVTTYILRNMLKNYIKKTLCLYGNRSLLIVTHSGLVDTVIENIKRDNDDKFYLRGIALVDCDKVGTEIDGVPIVAKKDNVVDYVCREWVDEVFLNFQGAEEFPEDLIKGFIEMGVVVHTKLAKASYVLGRQQFTEHIGAYTVLTTSINCISTTQLIAKRIIDIVGGIVGCLITGILYVILGPFIYIQSPGPVLFTQERVGRNGKRFRIYKFRSMYIDAEERKKELMEENKVKDGMMFKLEWDPRIIGSKKLPDGSIKKGIGNLIRDWSLDEFPQFINVLKGDMSLVGTRPPTVDEWIKYDLHHRARLSIKPGLTGMWQISGRSNITDFEEVVKLDKKYIVDWSMGLDIKILLKTVGVVFRKEGAM